MRFRIHTIDKTLFDGDVESVTLETESGEITVLGHHEPLVTLVRPGIVHVRSFGDSPEESLHTNGGFLEIRPENRGAVLLVNRKKSNCG